VIPDDPKRRGPRDSNRVDVHEPWELLYWSKKFHVDPDELREAAQTVGTGAADVERYLATRTGVGRR
jgi:hypothetical protein